jgi:nicotinate dehydrogenase subunit B
MISAQVGKPVRIQWMRDEVQQWDPKGPPHHTTIAGGIDANGKVIAWDWTSYQISSGHTSSAAPTAGDTLIGNLMGIFRPAGTGPRNDESSYAFPNMLKTNYSVNWDQALGTGLRAANFRDPSGAQVVFASEQFIDELAHAVNLDPINFRLTYLTDARDRRVLEDVRKASGWVSRTAPKPFNPSAKVVSGRGVAYQVRGGSVVGQVAEVTANRKTGELEVTKFTQAIDAGHIVNLLAVVETVKAAAMMSIGRALHESVRFDKHKVLSVDWATYPIANIGDAPAMKVVLAGQDGIHPNGSFVARIGGAGESPCRPVSAAIANAVFDATGVRVGGSR